MAFHQVLPVGKGGLEGEHDLYQKGKLEAPMNWMPPGVPKQPVVEVLLDLPTKLLVLLVSDHGAHVGS